MIDGKAKLSLGEGVSVQDLGEGEGSVVLAVGSGQLYTCNDTTGALLRCAMEGMDFDTAIGRLLEIFEVSQSELRADMAGIAGELVQEGILRIG